MSATRLFVPEVVQTSAMDCGPAALKALLEGFHVHASYGRLREACQTDVDGTSINDLETTAHALGLDAKQIMLPADHLFLASARALPALCVVRLPNGLTHFVVVWRRHGPFVQVMDPATGRRWLSCDDFKEELYQHTQPVPAAAWRSWASGDEFTIGLAERARALGVERGAYDRLLRAALADQTWASLAAFDAALRMTAAVVDAGAVRRGGEAARLLEQLSARAENIPERYWSVRRSTKDPDRLLFRGVVLVRVRGRSAARPDRPSLSHELRAALDETPPTPGRDLLRMMWADGAFAPSVLAAGAVAAAGAVVLEGLLWRTLLELGRDLATNGQRIAAVAIAAALLSTLLLLDWPIAALTLRLCRRLECRFREAFLRRIPRLSDRYFQSRLVSDMAERSHAVHQLRQVPDVALRFVRATLGIVATTAGICWLYPGAGWLAAIAAVAAITTPLLAQPYLAERDMRARHRLGALSRFYLDALRGGIMLRAHGAQGAMQREHGSLLGEWASATLSFQRTVAGVEVAQLAFTLGACALLIVRYVSRTGDLPGLLLLAYWTLSLPVLGETAASAAFQYPRLRNIALRLTEPLNAPDERPAPAAPTAREGHAPCAPGVAIRIADVTARTGGHTILTKVDVDIPAGQHVAIVGESGAGKSSLVGLLLGWLRPATGTITVDGRPLDASRLDALRETTAWIDPAVQLWNRPLFDNVTYGLRSSAGYDLAAVLDDAQLRDCVHRLPDGLRTPLGEDGTLVSGGEGQRIRIGRGFGRHDARLVILDEPARGLDRHRRAEILARCRERWPGATMLCVTHDVAYTLQFDRVLVVHSGLVVEDGPPCVLAEMAGSRYAGMLATDRDADERLWRRPSWRRLIARRGNIAEVAP